MIIKKITLDNIRSYTHVELEFTGGSTLLSGDIGSGKTSILLGIEFALFGLQPGQRGAFLLRNGENEGGVKLEFELDGQTIILERTLKKSKTISQDYCSITIDGVKKETSVMELKSDVLDLLKYPKEFSKKQNLLYKFTVYTPQEEMKEIIIQDATTRTNTLRHVFGIDKYKKILENSAIIISKIREEKRIKEALSSDLDREKEQLLSKEEDLETKYYNLESIEKELFLKQEKRKKIEEEKEEIKQKIDEKRRLEQEIEKTKIIIANKNESIYDNIKTIDRLKEKIKEAEGVFFDPSRIDKIKEEIHYLREQREELDRENLDATAKLTSFEFKNAENETIKQKLREIEICPTCLQDVDPVYKSNVFNKIDGDISNNIQQIKDFFSKKNEIQSKISVIKSTILLREKELEELQAIKIRTQHIEERRIQIEQIEKLNSSLEKDISLLNNHISSLRYVVFNLNKYDKIYEIKRKNLEEAFSEEKDAEIKSAELKKEIEVFSRQIEELKQRIVKFQKIRLELRYLSELEDWLSQKFVPIVSIIEKNVMLKLQAEFSRIFSEWFAFLVPDNFNVSLDDNFTPIVEYHDYMIDYAYLSGGERTAIALAYRLALNQVINSILSKIKTRNLVILDEPTDGFSDQQIDKMGEVLQQLNVEQLLIVSHEQKIEGFVDNLIKLKKSGGISSKEDVN